MSASIAFTWPKPPLSLNDRPRHWGPRNAEVQAARDAARLHARSKINRGELPTGEPIVVTLIWYVPTRTRRDADNPVATLKPICDGLVDAGLVPDDTPEWMDKRPVRIVYRKGEPGVELLIETRAEVDARVARSLMRQLGCTSETPSPFAITAYCSAHEFTPWDNAADVCRFAMHLAEVARKAAS